MTAAQLVEKNLLPGVHSSILLRQIGQGVHRLPVRQ